MGGGGGGGGGGGVGGLGQNNDALINCNAINSRPSQRFFDSVAASHIFPRNGN